MRAHARTHTDARTHARMHTHTHTHTHKLAVLPSVKRQVICVGDRMKMDKHKAWNNNSVVAPQSVGSMTTKGNMKPIFRAGLMLSQAYNAVSWI